VNVSIVSVLSPWAAKASEAAQIKVNAMMPESENLNWGRSRYVLKVVGLEISESGG
jgi:hypothetical protein